MNQATGFSLRLTMFDSLKKRARISNIRCDPSAPKPDYHVGRR